MYAHLSSLKRRWNINASESQCGVSGSGEDSGNRYGDAVESGNGETIQLQGGADKY